MDIRGNALCTLATVFGTTGLARCGGDGRKDAKPRVISTTNLTPDGPSPSSATSAFAPNVGDMALRVGETRKGRAGSTRLIAIGYPGPVSLGSDELVSIDDLTRVVIDISGKSLAIAFHEGGPRGVYGRCSDNCTLQPQ